MAAKRGKGKTTKVKSLKSKRVTTRQASQVRGGSLSAGHKTALK